MWKKGLLYLTLVAVFLALGGCKKMIPNQFEIETTSELGPNTLNRIDDLNETIATGVEVGPETRATIEELNRTIDEGLEFGFTEDTLHRIDIMLNMVEQGVGIKAGLDPETNRTVNNLIDTLDDQPSQWEHTLTEIIHTLEGSSSRVAAEMADEVSGLMVEARLNTQQLSASMGAEFRCNVDFMSTRAGDTLDQFIGRSLVDRLRGIVSGEKLEEEREVPLPRVCQMVPDQIDLKQVNDQMVYDSLIKISGYNFVEENKPMAHIADANGNPLPAIQLYPPLLSTAYQVQINLQGIDFSEVPPGSMVVLEWPTVTGAANLSRNELSILLPSEEPEPTEVLRPELTINVDDVVVRMGPGEKYYPLPAKAVRGAVYPVTGHNGDQSWWQIEFEHDLGWVPNTAVTRNAEPVGPAASIPHDPPQAAFSMSSTSGKAPLEIHFQDQSQGNPTAWEWEVIPEEGGKSNLVGEEYVSHEFSYGGTFQVKLHVSNQWGEDEAVQTVTIEGPDLVFNQQPFLFQGEFFLQATGTPDYGQTPILFKNFTDIPEKTVTDTGVSTEDYNCAIVSLAANEGRIGYLGSVIPNQVMSVFLNHYGETWEIYLDFSSIQGGPIPGDPERWSAGVMCVDQASSFFVENILFTPTTSQAGKSLDEYVEVPEDYTCTVAGYDLQEGSVSHQTKGDVFRAYLREQEGDWEIKADFLNGDYQERWEVQVLCFYENPGVVLRKRIPNLPSRYLPSTGISASEYACGISGLEVKNTQIDIGKTGALFRAFTHHQGGEWRAYLDIVSHNDQNEKWNVNLLCIHRSAAEIQISSWGPGWAVP